MLPTIARKSDAEIRTIAYDLLEAGETFEAAGSDLPISEQLRVCRWLKDNGHGDDYLPDIVGGLTAEISAREWHGVDVRSIEISPRLWGLLLQSLRPAQVGEVIGAGTFQGVPIRRRQGSTFFCHGCGAPHDKNATACSFCKLPKDVIYIDGEILK
jgi:hypothetical protein